MTEKKRDFLWRSRFAMIKNSKKRRNSHYDKKKNNAARGIETVGTITKRLLSLGKS